MCAGSRFWLQRALGLFRIGNEAFDFCHLSLGLSQIDRVVRLKFRVGHGAFQLTKRKFVQPFGRSRYSALVRSFFRSSILRRLCFLRHRILGYVHQLRGVGDLLVDPLHSVRMPPP